MQTRAAYTTACTRPRSAHLNMWCCSRSAGSGRSPARTDSIMSTSSCKEDAWLGRRGHFHASFTCANCNGEDRQ